MQMCSYVALVSLNGLKWQSQVSSFECLLIQSGSPSAIDRMCKTWPSGHWASLITF